jgi:ribosomal protein L11 methylase PrmA
VGVDVEAPSIAATHENAAVNGVTVGARLVGPDDALPGAPLVVANISLESVQALPARIEAATLVTSGYFASEEPRLGGYAHASRTTLDGWACDVYRRA